MCSTCKNSTHYGQNQPDARKADVDRLKKVAAARDAKNRKNNAALN
jgi:hypothetical protein